MEKVVKKQKEEFDVTVLKLRKQITTLELEKDDLEQYEKIYEKVDEFFKEACPDIPVSCIDRAHGIGSEYKSYRNKKKCCSIIVRFTSFRDRFTEIGNVLKMSV